VRLTTTRFGRLSFRESDILRFPYGIIGWERCCQWLLLPDSGNPAVAWLQSVDQRAIALPVVDPKRFLPALTLQLSPHQLARLPLKRPEAARALVVMSQQGYSCTLNLRAPILMDFGRRLGCQVVTTNELPVRCAIGNLLRGDKRIA
jgi:flagellar assembly factor FliW